MCFASHILLSKIINQLTNNQKNKTIMKSIAKSITLVAAFGLVTTLGSYAQDGAALFKAKCSACHKVDGTRMVGPGLAGINEKRSQEWLINWIRDSQAMIASGDADAIAIFEEYNKSPMIPFADLSDEEIIAMLKYVDEANAGSGSTGGGEVAEAAAPVAPVAEVEYTAEDMENGKHLFTGEKRFENGGPSCITCHNVSNDDIIPGGLLAKDLTNVYDRMGDAGVKGIVTAPPFPAMVNSYGNHPVTDAEANQLAAFFKYADKVSASQSKDNGYKMFLGGGAVGLLIILVLVSVLWSNRKKNMTKKDIFSRQLKGNDSVES